MTTLHQNLLYLAMLVGKGGSCSCRVLSKLVKVGRVAETSSILAYSLNSFLIQSWYIYVGIVSVFAILSLHILPSTSTSLTSCLCFLGDSSSSFLLASCVRRHLMAWCTTVSSLTTWWGAEPGLLTSTTPHSPVSHWAYPSSGELKYGVCIHSTCVYNRK